MAHRERVNRCFLSLAVYIFLLALAANATPVAYLDGMFHKSDVVLSEPERDGMLLAGTPHARIAIDGDANFSETALLEGWPGDGSPENPYIIDGLDIDISSNDWYCISITNAQVNFIISNCSLTGAIFHIIEYRGYPGAGIFLENVTNCELKRNIIDSDAFGIEVVNSKNSTINDNTCYGGIWRSSIDLKNSTYNTVVNNTCNDNLDGIRLEYSTYNTVVNNTCNDNYRGIELHDSDFNTFSNNTCNNNAAYGISLYESDFNTFSNNTCTRNDCGIFIHASNNNTVTDNICTNNRIGIYFWTSHSNKVENNICFNNTEHDIIEMVAHDSFNITSNEDFINQVWPGSGTADDPFIISGLYIESDSLCVGIFNTTSHFVIRNCEFYGMIWGMQGFSGTGVLFANVTNGVLENNRFSEGEYGIVLDNVTHCRISKNWIEMYLTCIELESTHSSALLDNTIQGVEIGIMSRRCSNCTMANNTIDEGESGIWLDDPDGCILENNTIDGGGSGIWIQGSNSRITENIISNCGIGIKLEGNNSKVTENTISDCGTGISLGDSWNCILDFNRLYRNAFGIELSDSIDCIIVDNLVHDNWDTGIVLGGSRNCTLDFNKVHLNKYGIELSDSIDCIIADNLVHDNWYIGIMVDGSRNCTLNFNGVQHSEFGIRIWNSNDCLIVDNLVCNNTVGISLNSLCVHNRIFGNKIGWNGVNAKCDGADNLWDDGVSRGNIWSNDYFAYQCIIPGEGQCIDHYPSPWFPRTYEGPVIFLLGGVLFLLPVGMVLGSRRHVASAIIQKTSDRLVFWFRKREDEQGDIIVPARYRLVSRLRKKKPIKRADVDES